MNCPKVASSTPTLLSLQPPKKQRQLTIALGIVGSFALVEGAIGWLSHSLALMAEAGHLMADCAALGLALWASVLSRRAATIGWIGMHQLSLKPADRRAETWAAFANGVGLVLLALWLLWEAWHHWGHPQPEIASLPMLLTAIAGVVVNVVNVSLLHPGSQQDLNLRGAFLHVLADLLSSLGVIAAAIAVALLHWLWADCAISFGIAALIATSALPLLVQSWKTLVEKGLLPGASLSSRPLS
ncbi:MAG: cation diffusion facilitator family transporter [Synechococcales bacterium]|nr:cation diffusion facilitator family transporter [Synechococcales bacterium]